METERKARRCAIYTRKSLEDSVEKEYNSIDAQRDAGESFVRSQKANGWEVLPKRYDDYGFSGGNVNRPALKELLADCEAGYVDVVVIYKLDRLSRSICDFAELSRQFDKWNVSFVAVTQEINTATSAGRMMLNILMTFAQYEREVIAERIRDKMAATRRRGLWAGGIPPYGYRVVEHRLVQNPDEVPTARRVFERYLQIQSPRTIARELNADEPKCRRGGSWTPRQVGDMLRNVAYIGKISYKGEVFDGEHEGIIDLQTWDAVRQCIDGKGAAEVGGKGRACDAPLKGLLRCGACGGAMTPSYSYKGKMSLRYYACVKDMKRAESACPIKRVPAGMIEKSVFECIGNLLRSPQVAAAIADLAGVEPRQALDALCESWIDGMTQPEKRRLMLLLVENVVLHETEMVVELKTAGMKKLAKEVYEN